MSSYEIYFQLLPSDLCAASNFRHLYFFVAGCETLLSLTTGSLAMALSVAMFTHRAFIQLHTGSHPFLQASTFMLCAVALFFRSVILIGLTCGILMNDAEIFVCCAKEDIEQMRTNSSSASSSADDDDEIYCDSDVFDNKRHSARHSKRWPTIPGPYSCGTDSNNLYASAARLTLSYRYSRDPSALTRRSNPTEKARKCFQRRQACLLRQRHILAAFPIVQLLCGAISTAFWFSINDSDMSKTKEILESQLPSLQLFNSFLALWVVGLIHSPFFLLVATWHYARVDWQMQILAVHNVLGRWDSDEDNDGGRSRGARNTEKKVQKRLHKLPTGKRPCPNCQERVARKVEKTMKSIRNSRTLRKAVAKAERLTSAGDDFANLSRQSTRDHRIAALSALTGSKTAASDEDNSSEFLDKGAFDSMHGGSVRRSQAPFSVPVSPTSLSTIINAGEAKEDEEDAPTNRAASVRIPTTYLQDERGGARLSSLPSRPASAVVLPSKSALKTLSGIEVHRTSKRVSFPACLPSKSERQDVAWLDALQLSRPSPSSSDGSVAATGAEGATHASSPMTVISEEGSGASISSSTVSSLVQPPTRAIYIAAPRSAPAEHVSTRKLV